MNSSNQVAGKIDGSLNFTGASNSIDCGNDNSLDTYDAITLTAWINPYNINNDHWIFNKYSSSARYFQFRVNYAADGIVAFMLGYDSGASFEYSSVSNSILTLGQFNYLVGTWDKSIDSGKLKIFLDGSEVTYGTQASLISSISPNTLELFVGCYGETYAEGGWFNGIIDEARVENITRNSTYINQTYQNAIGTSGYGDLGAEEAPSDTTPPTYSDNSTNSTIAGADILHSLKYTDETGLATSGGYVFSFDNGTGTLVNDSWTAFSSNPDWSNVTKTVNSTSGATIRWCVYANDTSNNWNSTSCVSPFSYVTIPANIAPTITANATSPANVYTNTDWMLNLTVTDPDAGDTITAYTQFYVNGTASGSEYSLVVSNNTNTNVANLSSSGFNKGATLIAEFWAGDGTDSSTKENTTQVTVQNSGPTIEVQNTFVNCSAGHCFNVTAGVYDLDSGADIVKTNISTSSGTCTHYSNTTSGNYFNVTYNCSGIALTSTNIRVGFNDSSGAYVQTTQSSNVYPDQAPTDPTDITGFPGNLYVDSSLTVSASGGTDADNDIITYHFMFYNVNESATRQDWSATNSYTITTSDAHDVIRVYAKSTTDYANSSGSYSEEDFVDDKVPTLTSNPTINDTTPGTDDILNCDAGTYNDIDNDAQGASNWKWFKNSTVISGETSQTLDLSTAGNGNKSDLIICSEQPTNSYGIGLYYNSSSVTILNTAPTQPSLTYPDNESYINSIVMNWTASFDADGDTVYYYVLVNGTQACYTTGLNCSYSPANAYYQWNVTPYDGYENGTSSVSRFYTYDTINPQLTITTSNNTVSNTLTTIEGTASDTNEDTIYANNTAWTWNTTYTNWKFINNTNIADGLYHILITANDSAGNTNSSLFAFTYDTTAPTPSNTGKNDSTIKVDDSVLFYTQWLDSLAGLNYSVFSWNNSGTMQNDSAQALTEWSNITKIVNATENSQVKWIIYTNDSAGNWNNTGTQSFTVAAENTAPTIIANVTSPASVYTNTDWMLNLTVTDPDSGDTLTAYTEFYVNGSSLGSVDSLNVTNGTNTNVANLSSSNFGKGATLIAEFWAGDATVNTTKYNTTQVTVLNSLPSKVVLSYPENNDSFFTNRTPRFNWTAATDVDNDNLTYHFQLSIHADVSSPLVDEENMSNLYYDQQTEFDFDTYYWKVRANDSEDAGDWSDIWNFTVTPSVSIVLVNDSINFGTMDLDEINDTTNDAPKPFILEQRGNTEANVSIKATPLWSSSYAQLNTSYFQFMVDNSTEANSFDWLNSQITWADMSDVYKKIIRTFNYSDSNDLAEIEIRVVVPSDETPVAKSSIITVYGTES